MSIYLAVLLGALQGITEFLPVSSSGHLVLVQSIMPGFTQAGVVFDAILHAGTVLAVLIYFRKTLLRMKRNYLWLLAIGTIPAAVIGVIFQDHIEGLFLNTKIVGVALLVTAILNYYTDKSKKDSRNVSRKDAFIVGVFQAFAILPGISRSGSTIFGATRRGIDKKTAAEFSFLLSVPAIVGANVLQFATHYESVGDIKLLIFGFFSAFVFGYFSIKAVLTLLVKRKFRIFSIYLIIVGSLSLIFL